MQLIVWCCLIAGHCIRTSRAQLFIHVLAHACSACAVLEIKVAIHETIQSNQAWCLIIAWMKKRMDM